MFSAPRELISHEATEVLTGLIGIGLTLVVQALATRIRDVGLQKKFPIAGTYITRYVDHDCLHTDIVKLRQRGRHVTGESVPNVERDINSRKWLYKGEIMTEGYVQGSYKPETIADKGFGAFFLKFEKNGDLKGYWIGKDADEVKIVSGEYIFLRQPNFSIGAIDISDQSQVLRIAEARLGDAYINRDHLISGDDKVALCARIDKTVVSFATARMLGTTDFLQAIRERLGAKLPSLLPLERRVAGETKIGFVASAATDSNFEGRGLGAELVEQCIAGLENRGANVMVATAWKSNKGVQAGSILECRGFQRLMDLPGYWELDSLTNGYSCPTCGNPPCHCTAVLYVRNRHAPLHKTR
jgi:ribosomal protein S18 acetylase RimI-like enzyme